MRVAYTTGIRTLPSRPELPSPPESLPQLYNNFLELGVMAEELGFDRVWLSEHHFAEDDWDPSPLLVLSALSQRTKRVRLGTFVTLIAMHNPLRLAEDCATLDILSNGRFDFGYGAGGMAFEYNIFGIDPKESFGRAYESLDILTRCWTEEEFSHHGKYFKFDNVRLRPKPVNRPIPIYSGGTGLQSVRKAAERGYGMVTALHLPGWEGYEGIATAAGKKVDIVSGPTFIHIADSKQQAWDECEVGMQWCLEFYKRRGLDMPVPPVGEFRKVGKFYGVPAPVGTPQDVLETLSPHKDAPCDEIVFQFGFPGMPHEYAKRAMRVFAKECLPEIKSWGRARIRLAASQAPASAGKS
jgi:alkanesulfonate monooxygenase SsuD/methylene tetrahydromethanopterin reductase-like flavin-dependent oxidoreductase (luciferase family)